ncbi:MAG: glycoside hydrolase family 5 protein [Chitinophagaceae bacterium]|nr:MAG: glycoside hydrolase family 5 protein [Chitinophagaceae bacterium]
MRTRVFFFIFLIMSIATTDAQPVKQHGKLKVSGTQLTDQYNKAVVLRGMSFGWHNWWPRFYNKESVDWLATDWKCNVVRAAMGIEPAGAYLTNPELATQKIESVIEGAIQSGIYVIVDWHSHDINTKEAKEFFTRIAKKYGQYPNLIYEIFNEPDEESWKDVKNYSEDLIATIRAIDPDNIILVGSPHWDQDIHIVAADPIKNVSNIMYTVHFYAATHKQYLRDRTDAAIKKGIPVFISESAGMEATGDGPINEAEWENWINWCEERKVSWIVWSVSDKDETCSILEKSASSTGGWKDSDLKLSGIKAREFIRKFNQGNE